MDAKTKRDTATQRAYRRWTNGIMARYVVRLVGLVHGSCRYDIYVDGAHMKTVTAPTCDAALTEFLGPCGRRYDNAPNSTTAPPAA